MISRLTSEPRMPSCPIEIPSETAIVTNSNGKPPASRTPCLGPLRQPVERHVARRDLVPRRRHPDLRAAPVGVGHADGAQHGAGRSPANSVGDLVAAGFGSVGHGRGAYTLAAQDYPAKPVGSLRPRGRHALRQAVPLRRADGGTRRAGSRTTRPRDAREHRSLVRGPRHPARDRHQRADRSARTRSRRCGSTRTSTRPRSPGRPPRCTSCTGSSPQHGGSRRRRACTRAVDTRTFYVVPRVNPDGVELALANAADVSAFECPPTWPRTDEPDGLVEGDVDGDGRILTMRVVDAERRVEDRRRGRARLMVPRDARRGRPGSVLPAPLRRRDPQLRRRARADRARAPVTRPQPQLPGELAHRGRAAGRGPVPVVGARGAHGHGGSQRAAQHLRLLRAPHVQRRDPASLRRPRRRPVPDRGPAHLQGARASTRPRSRATRRCRCSTTSATTRRT